MAAKKEKEQKKVPAGDIAEPMLLAGTFTRAQIIEEIRRLRPDFKDPSAVISSRFRELVHAGKSPGLVEAARTTRQAASRLVEANSSRRREAKLARLEQWAKETTEAVSEGFAKLAEFQRKVAAQPKARKVWA